MAGEKGQTETYRGAEYTVDLVPKLKVELVVLEPEWETAVETLVAAARTGEIGDGKIFESDLTNAIRIRTGEAGQEAL